MMPIPFFVKNTIYAAVNDTERILGRPGKIEEIYVVFQHHYGDFGFRVVPYILFWPILQNLYREDFFFCDEEFHHYSTSANGKGKAKYENFTTRF